MITNDIHLRITGTRPLLMARGEAANPFDEQKKHIDAISQKRGKSLEDYERLSYLQFQSSMYFDEEVGPYLPVDNLLKCMTEGAQKYKEGPKVKALVSISGLVGKKEDPGIAQLIYSGPRDVEELYRSGFLLRKMGKINKVSILTSRAVFHPWAVEFICHFTEINQARIMDYWTTAGAIIGIGAWRLRYGLFRVERIK